MRRFRTFHLLTALMAVFLVAGFVQAQTTTISGTVTTGMDSMAVDGYKMWIYFKGDSSSFKKPLVTNDEGFYTQTVLMGRTYVIESMDSYTYEPVKAEIEVGQQPVVQNFHLEMRDDLLEVTGNVFFQGSGVANTDVYFLKISDSVDTGDFREYEAYFNVPPSALKWASYHAQTDMNGGFTVNMLAGKYVVHVPATDSTLSYWSAIEVQSAEPLEDIILKEMTTISGTVMNAGAYDYVKVMAHPTRAGRPYQAMPDSLTGDYVLDVAPGEYVVRVQAFFDEHMYMEFYNSDTVAHKPADAEVIEVGQEGKTGIDFNLPEPQVYDFTISGMVTSAQSGKPLVDAEVAFISYNYMTNLFRGYDTTTDDKGQYMIEGQTMLKEDSLVGFAAKEGFFAEFYEDEATFLTADPIVYHANEDVTGVNFALDTLDTENAYSISGMVYDEEGNVVKQGQVTAYSTAVTIGQVTAEIDSNGYYEFEPVFPSGASVFLQAWGGFGYLPEIYQDAESWKDATAIEINAENVTGIDFTLKKVGPSRFPLANIRGLVDMGSGQLAKTSEESIYENSTVYVKPADDPEATWTNVDYVDEDGKFNLGVQEDGEYLVKFTSPDESVEDTEGTVTVENREGEIKLTPTVTGIDNGSDQLVIKSHQLHDAYPNPFNPSTTIQVDMAANTNATLVIYNVLGQKVKTLHDGMLEKGVNTFTWRGNDQYGNQVASGLYFYQLKTDNVVDTKAVTFLK